MARLVSHTLPVPQIDELIVRGDAAIQDLKDLVASMRTHAASIRRRSGTLADAGRPLRLIVRRIL